MQEYIIAQQIDGRFRVITKNVRGEWWASRETHATEDDARAQIDRNRAYEEVLAERRAAAGK